MTTSYAAAFAPGTLQNHLRQARTYLLFTSHYNVDPLNPTVTTLLLYIQLLANSHKNPLTVKNYFSGAKTHISHNGGNLINFTSPFITNLFKGISRLSTHVAEQAPEISPTQLMTACDILQTQGQGGRTVRAAALMGFATFLRQSNLLPCPGPAFSHCITRQDISHQPPYLWITIKSSKTISHPSRRVSLPILSTNSRHCPVKAWLEYAAALPLPPSAPGFMLSATSYLTPHIFNSFLRRALATAGYPGAHKFTVHSLRRSGARAAARGGAPEADVMDHGTWSSAAVTTYVPKKLYSLVPTTIAQVFGHR